METLQFKTNIKCSGCVAAVTPYLQNIAGIDKWEVAIENPDKILTVQANTANDQEVQNAVQAAGFTAIKI